jgi:hypothetical protein
LQLSVRAPCALVCATWFDTQPTRTAATSKKTKDLSFTNLSCRSEGAFEA